MKENLQRLVNDLWKGSGLQRHFSGETTYRPQLAEKGHARTIVLFFIVVFIGTCVSVRWIDTSIISSGGVSLKALLTSSNSPEESEDEGFVIPLNCSQVNNLSQVCSTSFPATFPSGSFPTGATTKQCPHYFRWIHEDLRPWKESGITREMVERARTKSNFRLVLVDGRLYYEKYSSSFQTRDVFTLWGILQLLRRYPGRLPDFDIMFNCNDRPVIRSRDYEGPNATAPPPLFHYCGDDWTLDIVFPDWSFWGWPEINIKPWIPLLKDLKEGNQRIKWDKREPYAYWKGNPKVCKARQDLVRCNVTDKQDWNGRFYVQNWVRESRQGFKKSNLADQCTHRYKVYIEGAAWSVSEKYILACDSPTLLVTPHFYDFFTRSLLPGHHYWPIKDNDKCRSIKFAVDWGNKHKNQALAIGKAGSNFIQEELKMNNVYDYMFHLLSEYSKLLRYKPTIPPQAVELCSEVMACPAGGLKKVYMMESMVKGPTYRSPCMLPPPFDPPALEAFLKEKENSKTQVEKMERQFSDKIKN
ncbi:PREDICTED: O-glucosyltransferase rumi homolog [Nelumbo nucifera]|uniref:O-glucosyltransferase rumi homolog n=1 Tax=Nelumbo nucifera TaxID=4432 RepID=A0A1U8A1E4_NELNU|nr:PREDICTED: O-glucosyltransferase rumi homolog [Nelumbo nucifera]